MSLFITFEGIEGCGKTTQIGLLTSFLERTQRPFLLTREPGGTEVGEKIRQILLSSENAGLSLWPSFSCMLPPGFSISPGDLPGPSAMGKSFSATASPMPPSPIRDIGRGLDRAWIEEIHSRAMENLKPDLTFLLDLPVEEGLRRAWKRMEKQPVKEDRFEKEALDFHRRVREGYLTLARKEPKRIIVLDGMKDEQTLHREIVSHLSRRSSEGRCPLTRLGDRKAP